MKFDMKAVSRNTLLWIFIGLLAAILIVLRIIMQTDTSPVAQNPLGTEIPFQTPPPDQTGTVAQIYINANMTLTAIYSEPTLDGSDNVLNTPSVSQDVEGTSSTPVNPLVEEVQSDSTNTGQDPNEAQTTKTPSPSGATNTKPASSSAGNLTPTHTSTGPPPAATLPPPPKPTSSGCTYQTDDPFELTILVIINEFRSSNGLPKLELHETLNDVAHFHSEDMACRDFYDHLGSDGSTFIQRLQASNYAFSKATELLYVGRGEQNDPQKAFEAWLNGPSSTAQLLYPAYIHAGIGYVYKQDSSYGGYLTLIMTAPSFE